MPRVTDQDLLHKLEQIARQALDYDFSQSQFTSEWAMEQRELSVSLHDAAGRSW